MKNRASTFLLLLSVMALAFGVVGSAAQQAPRSAEFEREIIDTVHSINRAFLQGDLKELSAYMHDEVTMLHGHDRIHNLREAEAEWTKLFAIRRQTAMAYNLRTRDFKVQTYGDVAVVTFSYDHPRLVGARISSESGKAIYVLVRQPAAAGKKPIVMVHCSVILDRPGSSFHPLP